MCHIVPVRQDGRKLSPVADIKLLKDSVAPCHVLLVALAALQVLRRHGVEAVHGQHLSNRLVQSTCCQPMPHTDWLCASKPQTPHPVWHPQEHRTSEESIG